MSPTTASSPTGAPRPLRRVGQRRSRPPSTGSRVPAPQDSGSMPSGRRTAWFAPEPSGCSLNQLSGRIGGGPAPQPAGAVEGREVLVGDTRPAHEALRALGPPPERGAGLVRPGDGTPPAGGDPPGPGPRPAR